MRPIIKLFYCNYVKSLFLVFFVVITYLIIADSYASFYLQVIFNCIFLKMRLVIFKN